MSYPNGFAAMAGLTRAMTVLSTSGQDWAERTDAHTNIAPLSRPDTLQRLNVVG